MTDQMLQLTAQIAAAYVSHNSAQTHDLPRLLTSIYNAISKARPVLEAVAPPPVPAVNPRKSVFRDHLVCLEDGRKLKMLKYHLMNSFGMTPEQYREKWKLPHDYPMVAPDYAATRSALAKGMGLGTKRQSRARVIKRKIGG